MAEKRKAGKLAATLGVSFLALLASLIITGLLIAICGYNPFEVFFALFVQSFATRSNIALVLSEATPLIFAGVSFVVGIRVGLVNVGAEGQMVAGGMCAAIVGAYCSFLPGPLLLLACLIASMIGGGLMFLLCSVLKMHFNTSEVITGVLLNNIAVKMAEYFCNGPLKPKGVSIGQTPEIAKHAYLIPILSKTKLTWAFPLAIISCILVYILFSRTVLGYEMRVTGVSRTASTVAGIRTAKMYYLSSMISGAFAGLGGAALVLGVYHRYMDGLTSGIGFVGISVAALASYLPLVVPFSGILFGMLSSATTTLARTTNAPLEIMDIVQGLVVVFISAPAIVTSVKDWPIFRPLKRLAGNGKRREAA